MREIMGRKYLTDKEAAERYGYSQSWFIRRRTNNQAPNFVQFETHSRVLYPLEETDAWFMNKLQEKE